MLSHWQTLVRVLPTRWRRKPASIDMERNYVIVTLCIENTAKAAYATSRKTVTGIAFQVAGPDMSRVAVVLSRRTKMTADDTHVDTILPHTRIQWCCGAGRRNNYVVLSKHRSNSVGYVVVLVTNGGRYASFQARSSVDKWIRYAGNPISYTHNFGTWSDDERILKIGLHLPKLRSKVKCVVSFLSCTLCLVSTYCINTALTEITRKSSSIAAAITTPLPLLLLQIMMIIMSAACTCVAQQPSHSAIRTTRCNFTPVVGPTAAV